MRILSIMFIISFSWSAAALGEYNPATGENDIILIDQAQEVRIGKSLSKSVEKQFGLTKDAGMQKRVEDIGQRIAAICDRSELTYSFTVLEGEKLDEEAQYNAFALPGGYVYIFKGMVEDMQSDDELASILAHEVGHVVSKHSVKRLQSSMGIAGLSLLGVIVGKSDGSTQARASTAITQLMMAYSRKAEFEADKLSVRYLKKAEFDPKAAVSVIDRMLERQFKGEVRRYRYFRTHPHTSERKAMINKEIDGKLAFDDYINAPAEKEEAFW